MGRPETNSTMAVTAVILIGALLVIFIGGVVVMVGGFVFFSSTSQPMVVQVPASPIVTPIGPITAVPVNVNAQGEIDLEGETYSLTEFRSHLEELRDRAEQLPPQLLIHSDCPEDIRLQVLEVYVDVIGEQPIETRYQSAKLEEGSP